MGCCWDTRRPSHCFYALPDGRITVQSDAPSAGFAAGMTALAFILLYAAVGAVYLVKFR